jgi:hypothetical protein
MLQLYWITIVKRQNGCDCVDKETGTNKTKAHQTESVRWHNELDEEVIITFEGGRSPFGPGTDKIVVPAKGDGNSDKYDVAVDPDQNEEEEYKYGLTCDPPVAGPIIIVPPPPPPPFK